jgi:hypothetical protein
MVAFILLTNSLFVWSKTRITLYEGLFLFIKLELDLFFTETILFPVPLFLLLQLLDCIFTHSGKLHPLMNGYTTAGL